MAIKYSIPGKRLRRWLNGLVISVLICGAVSCSIPPPSADPTPPNYRSPLFAPASFHETDMLGTWETLSARLSHETLLLTADHRFIQIYDESPSSLRYQGEGTWWIEQRPSGCTYLHMHGMRFFYGGDGTVPLWERCEQRGGQMSQTLILLIAERPNLPRHIGLLWPGLSGYEQSGMSMWLVADEHGQAIPRSTPSSP